MKHIALLFVLFSLNLFAVEVDLTSPRATFKTFLKSMVKVKKNSDIEKNLDSAIQTFDLSLYDKATKKDSAKNAAKYLINTLDRLEKVEYEKLPNKLTGDSWVYTKTTVKLEGESKSVEISMIKKGEDWLFSTTTLASIKDFYESLKAKDTVAQVNNYTDWKDKIYSKLPAWTKNKTVLISNAQWMGIFILIVFGLLCEKIVRIIVGQYLIRKFSKESIDVDQPYKNKFTLPFGILTFSIIWFYGIRLFELDDKVLSVLVRLGYVLISVSAVMIAIQIINFLTIYFERAASRTATKFDDILIPLLSKSAKVLVYCIGLVLIAHSLTINVTNIVAGLGIGGLAFALAAKDTLSNLFGSLTVVLDRPFDIGDWVIIGSIEGTVMEVGFRSTRIRSFNDSIITIPNNNLTNASIDNYGMRRYRRLKTHVTIQYDTPPAKIEAFCEGIRTIIAENPYTRNDLFHVYLNKMSSSSLDILLQTYFEVDDYAVELAGKHKLYMDIIRLAEDMGVDFAFPTQTLHVYDEQHKVEEAITADNAQALLKLGKEKSSMILKNPMSGDKPRSNTEALKDI